MPNKERKIRSIDIKTKIMEDYMHVGNFDRSKNCGKINVTNTTNDTKIMSINFTQNTKSIAFIELCM